MAEGRELWDPTKTPQVSKVEDFPWNFGENLSGLGYGLQCQPKVQQWHPKINYERC